jgi:hypothetical protein
MLNKLIQFLTKAAAIARPLLDKIQHNRKLRLLANLVMVLATAIFLGGYIIRQWSELQDTRLVFDLQSILFSFILIGVNLFFFILAWYAIIRVFQSKSSFLNDALIYSLTQITRLLPTPAWYFASRIYHYSIVGLRKRSIIIATFAETVFHASVGFIFYCIISFQINQGISWLYILSALILTAVLTQVVVSYMKRNNFVLTTKESILRFGSIAVLYLATWLISFPFFYFIIQSLTGAVTISLIDLWKIWIISSLFAYIGSYTLGGLGFVREFSLVLLLTPYLSPPLCVAVAVLSRLVTTVGSLLWSGMIIIIVRIIFRFNPLSRYQKISGVDE